MSDEIVVKDFSELPDFSKMELGNWGLPKHWGVCIVGTSLEAHGVRQGTKCVVHFEINGLDDIIETFYPIPSNVLILMKYQEKDSIWDLQKKLKDLLGF